MPRLVIMATGTDARAGVFCRIAMICQPSGGGINMSSITRSGTTPLSKRASSFLTVRNRNHPVTSPGQDYGKSLSLDLIVFYYKNCFPGHEPAPQPL